MVAESSLPMASNVATFEEETKRYEINQHADVKMYNNEAKHCFSIRNA